MTGRGRLSEQQTNGDSRARQRLGSLLNFRPWMNSLGAVPRTALSISSVDGFCRSISPYGAGMSSVDGKCGSGSRTGAVVRLAVAEKSSVDGKCGSGSPGVAGKSSVDGKCGSGSPDGAEKSSVDGKCGSGSPYGAEKSSVDESADLEARTGRKSRPWMESADLEARPGQESRPWMENANPAGPRPQRSDDPSVRRPERPISGVREACNRPTDRDTAAGQAWGR